MLHRRYIALAIAWQGRCADAGRIGSSDNQQSSILPAEIKAKSGDSVVWVNKDFVAHTATVAGGWDLNIESDKSPRFVLRKPGAFDYYCRFHPNMTGKISCSQSERRPQAFPFQISQR
jgi:plastocyanin